MERKVYGKKKIVIFILVFVLLEAIVVGTTIYVTDIWSESKKETVESSEQEKETETERTLNDETLSEEEVLKYFYEDTKARINSIHTTETNIQPSGGGKAYYVSNSGDDHNDGTSPQTPIATIAAVNELDLKAGDVVFFERGGVWRGKIKAYNPGVTYSAYGQGNKPEIYASSKNYAQSGQWLETDVANIYRYSEKIYDDVGTIVFEGGEAHGIKCVLEERNGQTYNVTTGRQFNTYADLTEDMHFFHDSNGTKDLYLYCSSGNPANLYNSIEFAEKRPAVEVGTTPYITIDNLTFRYCGGHAVSASFCTDLTVQNCEFYWIGGSIQFASTRYGNGVEIWGSANHFTVNNCYFNQIYDAAVTFQFRGDSGSGVHCQNIQFTNNVMEYCNYSVEYVLDSGKSNDNYFRNFLISGNHMWYAGYGYCTQRPDDQADTHIKSWDHENRNKGGFIVSNNLFALAKSYLLETYSRSENQGAVYDSNTYIQFTNRYLGRNGNATAYTRFDDNVRTALVNSFGDKNAKIIWVNKVEE